MSIEDIVFKFANAVDDWNKISHFRYYLSGNIFNPAQDEYIVFIYHKVSEDIKTQMMEIYLRVDRPNFELKDLVHSREMEFGELDIPFCIQFDGKEIDLATSSNIFYVE